MKKIFLVFSMVLCTMFANAQEFKNFNPYGFWDNWYFGAGAVYSKPVDFNNWTFDNGANVGVDVRLEKQISKWWTLRADACIPGLKNTGFDRYGTALVGANLNLGKTFYLFGDGGMAFKRFDNKYYWTADAGIGANIHAGKHSVFYAEVGADCSSYLARQNATAYGKLGYMFGFGLTKKTKDAIAKLENPVYDGYVPASDYEALKSEKDACDEALNGAIQEINRMKECCNANNGNNDKEIARLTKALNDIKDNAVSMYGIPFSVLFKKNSVELDATAKEIIRVVAIEMNNDGGTYTLYGFGDYTGTEDYNQVISESRCESVLRELVKNGVNEDKVQVVGFGKSKYFGDNESYLNRRVTFVKNL